MFFDPFDEKGKQIYEEKLSVITLSLVSYFLFSCHVLFSANEYSSFFDGRYSELIVE